MIKGIHLCFDTACWLMRGRITDVPEIKLTLTDGATPFEPNVVVRFDLPGNEHALACVPLRALGMALETMCARVNAARNAAIAAAAPAKYGPN